MVLVFFELRLLTSQPPEVGTARWSQLRLGALGLRGPVSLNKSPPTRGDADRSRGAANFDVAGPRQRILNIHPLAFRGPDRGCDRPGVRTSAWFRTAQTVHQPQVRELLGVSSITTPSCSRTHAPPTQRSRLACSPLMRQRARFESASSGGVATLIVATLLETVRTEAGSGR